MSERPSRPSPTGKPLTVDHHDGESRFGCHLGNVGQNTKGQNMGLIKKIYETGMVYDKDGNEFELRNHISPDEGEFLINIINDYISTKKVIEIGCAFGISALHIGEAIRNYKDSEHIIIDPFQSSHYRRVGIHQIEKAGFKNFRLIEEPSGSALPALAADRASEFGFVFIDGWHTFDQTLVDLYYADQLLVDDGIVVIDDCALAPVAKAVAYFANDPNYEMVRTVGRHTTRQRIGGVINTLLPVQIAREILPHGLYDRFYVRCLYPSMVALRKKQGRTQLEPRLLSLPYVREFESTDLW